MALQAGRFVWVRQSGAPTSEWGEYFILPKHPTQNAFWLRLTTAVGDGSDFGMVWVALARFFRMSVRNDARRSLPIGVSTAHSERVHRTFIACSAQA